MKTILKLSRAQLDQLAAFLHAHPTSRPFVAKDQGAYVGATAGLSEGVVDNCIFYFPGCDPNKDPDWYDTTRKIFGGDDFGEHLERRAILDLADNPEVDLVRFTVTEQDITIEGFTKPAPRQQH